MRFQRGSKGAEVSTESNMILRSCLADPCLNGDTYTLCIDSRIELPLRHLPHRDHMDHLHKIPASSADFAIDPHSYHRVDSWQCERTLAILSPDNPNYPSESSSKWPGGTSRWVSNPDVGSGMTAQHFYMLTS